MSLSVKTYDTFFFRPKVAVALQTHIVFFSLSYRLNTGYRRSSLVAHGTRPSKQCVIFLLNAGDRRHKYASCSKNEFSYLPFSVCVNVDRAQNIKK